MSSLIVSTSTSVNKQQLVDTCELCALFLDKNIMLTNKCTYCFKNVCAQCCASIAELPFKSQHSLQDNEQPTKPYICLQCIVKDRHKIILKSIYKAIGNNIDVNIINIIALFAIQECVDCNKTYPKSWTIVQPDMMSKIVNNFGPKCIHIQSLWHENNNRNKYQLRYCKECNVEQERDVIFDAIYNSYVCWRISDDFEILKIIDIITLYSIGRIFSCSNFNNCNNDIIIDNNFDGLIRRKDINNKSITRSDTLDRIFCSQCTFEENRCDRINEKCSFCCRYINFGHNITCNGCLKRFCDQCVENDDNYCYLEKKYYFSADGKMKYYQYCDECAYWIYDDIDIIDDDISSISNDPYQQLIDDNDYTEYQSIDQLYYSM